MSRNSLKSPKRFLKKKINEFKINSISATRLELAANKLEDGHPLKAKLSDLATIYQAFEGMVKNAYDDSANDLEKLYELLCKHNFFEGCNVYVDGFSSFTACEHKIIGRIFIYHIFNKVTTYKSSSSSY